MAGKLKSKVSMLIKAKPGAIYEAFVDPKKITRFWLDKSSGPLVQGQSCEWEFKVPGARETASVERLVPNELISFTWSDRIAVKIEIERSGKYSIARVTAGDFASAKKAIDAAEGFSIVLCDLKIWLETGSSPGLVRDKAKLIAS